MLLDSCECVYSESLFQTGGKNLIFAYQNDIFKSVQQKSNVNHMCRQLEIRLRTHFWK